MNIKIITNKIILVKADSQKSLGDTFLRFQEFYENPVWKDQIFTLGQFRSWYSEKYGSFTYSSDWTGFNIPSAALIPFKDGLFDPLTKQEQEFLDLFKYRNDKFYIIGAQDTDPATLEHEICHGLFYTNPDYKKEMTDFIENNREEFKEVFDYISNLMYHESVHLDEVHAYSCENSDDLFEKNIFLAPEIVTKLKEIKRSYFPEK